MHEEGHMKTIVIIGGTYLAAKEALETLANAAGAQVKKDIYTSEAVIGDERIIAMGGTEQDVCFLRDLGFHIERIDVIMPHLISEPMGKRINHVRSTIRSMRLGMKLGG